MNTTGISSDLLQQLAPQTPTAGALTGQRDQLDKTGFLTLFIAQLQNQDPLSPMEPNELTAQLAQLTSVEQLTGINERLDKLASTTKSGYGASLLGMIGKDVRFDASQLAVEDGKPSRLNYQLAADATNVVATVRNASGAEVRTVELGAVEAGNRTFAWDGKTQNGRPAPDGKYSVTIKGTVGGQPTGIAVEAEGAVDGVDLSADPPVLLVNGARLTLDRVRQVRQPNETN
jgi:flagellar basal-body rod modification protein FlgD